MLKQELIGGESVATPASSPSSGEVRQASCEEDLESRFLVGELVDKLSGGSFKFPLKDGHGVIGKFVFDSMANTIDKVREVLGNKIPFERLDRVEYLFDLIGKLSETLVPFQPSKVVVEQPVALPQVFKQLDRKIVVFFGVFDCDENPSEPSIDQLLIVVVGNCVVGGAVNRLFFS